MDIIDTSSLRAIYFVIHKIFPSFLIYNLSFMK